MGSTQSTTSGLIKVCGANGAGADEWGPVIVSQGREGVARCGVVVVAEADSQPIAE